MNKFARTIIGAVLCGFGVASAHAALEILQNPHNMEIAYYQTAGLESWPGWDTDTLETAYDAGQVTITSGTVDLGNKLNTVDGLAPDYGDVVATTAKLAAGSWINYKFNTAYTGGRTLGSDTQNALRVNTFYHVTYEGFYYRLLYSTIDTPSTFHVLAEVRDVAPIAWKPKTITYDFGENSTLVRNIDTIRYEELHATGSGISPGAVVEFNASLFTAPTTARVDLSTQTATVPSLYNVGYNGWGDIYRTNSVFLLNDVNVKHLRIATHLNEICGLVPGSPLDLDYTTPEDGGVGFVDRINVAIANGWIPLMALTIHNTSSSGLPVWFYGEGNDSNGDVWTRYNSDGTKPGGLTDGDQLQEMSGLCQQIADGLVARGLSGLWWETMYESGHRVPTPAIHYNVASGINQADASAKFMGPATWPGSTVEDIFLKPYLQTYGADLLDYVSVHWYANLGIFGAVITMVDTEELSQLMDVVPSYGRWCKDVKAILDDPVYNPSGKEIGIAFTEYDVTAASAYRATPANPDWPEYRAASDTYLNTGYFGGVWNAAILCYMAGSDSLDLAFKYRSRAYYGVLTEGLTDEGVHEYCRTPLWYAWKLLQSKANLVEGNPMFQAEVQQDLESKIDIFAVGDSEHPRIILINRSFDARSVDVTLGGLASHVSSPMADRYIFNEDRSAQFIASEVSGSSISGRYSDAPAISPRDIALERVDELPLTVASGGDYTLQVDCGPISITVLEIVPGSVATIVGGSISNGMARLVVNTPGPVDGYYPKTTTNLVDGIWGSVAHSDDGVNPFHITNLTYSTVEGTNKVIYVEATAPQGFFSIGGAE